MRRDGSDPKTLTEKAEFTNGQLDHLTDQPSKQISVSRARDSKTHRVSPMVSRAKLTLGVIILWVIFVVLLSIVNHWFFNPVSQKGRWPSVGRGTSRTKSHRLNLLSPP